MTRFERLSVYTADGGVDAVFINKPESRRYYTGFSGTAGSALCSADCAKRSLFVDFRYVEQAKAQCAGWEIVKVVQNSLNDIAAVAKSRGYKRVGFESDYVTFESYRSLESAFEGIELVPLNLAGLRAIKDSTELAVIKEAVEIAEDALKKVINEIKPGVTERAVAVALENYMRGNGADAPAFPVIAASGARSALPHGIASDKIIESGDFLTLDFGAFYKGYNSDITRTFVVGKASARQREIYGIVLKAQLAAVNEVRAGLSNHFVDKIARNIISEAGYGENFGHGLGHGLGMAVHEAPSVSYAAGNVLLENGNLVTIEPGIYIPGFGGVRIEDDVVVRDGGCEILTGFTKELIEI